MDELQKLEEELEQLKKQYDQTNKQKSIKNLDKLSVGDTQEKLQKELDDLQDKKKKLQEDIKEQKTDFMKQLRDLQVIRDKLKEKEAELLGNLDESENAFRKIQESLLVNSHLPQKQLNFKGTTSSVENQSVDEPMDISYTCQIVAGSPYVLERGQALLTFEDEHVAKSVISARKHSLEINDTRVTVEAVEPPLGKSVKFEVQMNISSKKLKISNLPQDIPEETLKDKVELSFYKSGVGGAEIEKVDYNKDDSTACVTYMQNGVAQRVLRNDRHQLIAGGATCDVKVMPYVDIELNKLQMFSAVSSRSVLLSGMKKMDDQEEDDVQDCIQIHFQKESNGGGEVEIAVCSLDKKITPIFEEDLK